MIKDYTNPNVSEKEARELQTFGIEIEALDKAFENAFSKGMFIMGILSDVQEANAMQSYETARLYANRAKYLMSNYLPKDAEGRML